MMRIGRAATPSGGGQALVEMGARFTPALRAFFSRRASINDVEDLVQEVLLRIQKRQPEAVVNNVEGYLFEVAANVLIDRGRADRTRCRSAHCEFQEIHHPVDEMSPERVLQAREQMARALAALNELPERTRRVFVLVRFEEMSYKLVAQRLGVSVSAVEKHVMKALRHLNARLRDQNDADHAGQQDTRRPG
ncbi:RNA polymerase sigma factor [Caulobacter sp. AP07]|uniref:RNA polymerase sigma factor n=1 Tax=Caulobacter sp. AP07 TaxID=1144304 RepID=UPI001EE67671|nr:RNA polymerase sigma factor [Caulobacter sp. AP07]